MGQRSCKKSRGRALGFGWGLSCGSTVQGGPASPWGSGCDPGSALLCPDGVLRGRAPAVLAGMCTSPGVLARGTVGTAQGALLLRWWLWPQQLHIVLGAARPVCVRVLPLESLAVPAILQEGGGQGSPWAAKREGGWSMQQPRARPRRGSRCPRAAVGEPHAPQKPCP